MSKNIVIYVSKNGTTKETVEKIQKQAGATMTAVNLENTKTADIASADHIFFGCGIYMGKIDSKIKKFIAANKALLADKKVTFFIHGIISQDTYKQAVEAVVNGCLDSSKTDVIYLGGKLDITTQNFIVRKMLIKIAKQHNFDPYKANTLDQGKLDELLAMF